ncbi:Arc family DNA-binding protein [Kerstersia gyiorum]|uniref:Arc family DNA-binding protein n=1 Tax=Kerstersia gyiorum TaxID=206506 RepID=UPI00102B94FC|nr:Arc family DNA-binding protein [Kerstersia gyiorum]KAB0544169.1 Arc family DNA-binding protein [Kerstersia gyiorum]
MARTDPQVNFRMPADLRDRLAEAAKQSNRTLTAELVARLEASFAAPDGNSQESLRVVLEQLQRQQATLEDVSAQISVLTRAKGLSGK